MIIMYFVILISFVYKKYKVNIFVFVCVYFIDKEIENIFWIFNVYEGVL